MDFVGADDQIVGLGESGEIEQFLATPATADGVVRVAEQEEPGGVATGIVQRRHVPLPVGITAGQFDAIQRPPRKARRGKERWIDRRRRQHLAIDRPAGDVQASDQAR